MRRIKKQNSVLTIIVRIIVPIIIMLIVLFFIMFHNLDNARKLAYKYMLDTAEVLVDEISATFDKVNSEVYNRCKNNTYFERLPDKISPSQVENYEIFTEIKEDNNALKNRYGQEYDFYVYGRTADFLVCHDEFYFKDGYKTEKSEQMRYYLSSMGVKEWSWHYFYANDKYYLMNAYSREDYIFGCCIDLELLLENLALNNMGYQMIPSIRLGGDELVTVGKYADLQDRERMPVWGSGLPDSENYKFRVNGSLEIEMLLIPSDGIFEEILGMQSVFFVVLIAFVVLAGFVCSYLYLHLLRPMKEFVARLQNPEKELFLDNTDSFDVIELEVASKEFKELLEKIKFLKIAVYEKELLAGRVQLEYVQEQIQSHFYLNCLNILHAMAEKKQDSTMMHFLETLSRYMRYVIKDSYKLRKIGDELDHINDYIEIQRLRYKDAFTYEANVEERIREYYLPALVLQVFIENAVKHAVSLENKITVSLYITTEMLDEKEYLYIAISDTGVGFSTEILEAIEQDKPIYYDNRKHVGIENTKQRLKLIYGNRASMKLSNMAQGYGAVVELTLPLMREEEIRNEGSNCG